MPRSRLLEFQRFSGCGVKVAVIDSGIDASHPRMRGGVAGGVCLSIDPKGGVVCSPDFADLSGHGTACAGIIVKKAPKAELYAVRIFDRSLGTDGRCLVAALRWAIEHGMDVVNLSLGTTDVAFRDELSEVCSEAAEAGAILVAAEHNCGVESYPALLSQVIGVTAGKVYGRYGYFYRPGALIECVARGDEQRLCWLQPREIMAGGTSFAAPHIAGIVALIRQAYPRVGVEEVREILQANASQARPRLSCEACSASGKAPTDVGSPSSAVGSGHPRQSNGLLGSIRKAALYPYNKEMHGFVRFIAHLYFEITGIADPVGKGLVGKDAGEAIGLARVGVRIAPKLRDVLEGADTLILSYVDEMGRISKRDVLRESIQMALDHGLNVFSFLSVPPNTYAELHEKARKRGLWIHSPTITMADVQRLLEKRPRRGVVDVPVLGVFGTSSQQGKFTAQLALRQRLMEAGYIVGQIGTEHHSELFGMDLAFPMGYASPLELPLQYYTPFVHLAMREICYQKRPDIMIVGSQSGTIPYDVDEHATHSLPTIAFVLGAKPDACILVVNSIDADDYIEDTINCIRGMAKAPTIALAMSDKEKHIRAAYGRSWVTPRQMTAEEIDRRLQQLEDRFGLPAVEIASDNGQQKMVDTVVDFFSGMGRDERGKIEHKAAG